MDGNTSEFGKRYAVLNLDLMSILINEVKDSVQGQSFISNCVRWNNAVHQKDQRPLTIFTTLYFSNCTQPELAQSSLFAKMLAMSGMGSFEKGSDTVEIYGQFVVDERDIVLQKTRWYAGAGNSLELTLKAQNIDTVIISGLSLSGVVMSTVYRLFDLDYKIYVIWDNVLELPGGEEESTIRASLGVILEKMLVKKISITEALEMLQRSEYVAV
ncbi:Isochorismatase-like protein [Mariannaea sp. PMI_226]|nr:Isochorismatase-like protein [Mariannaea sp. PMI_226]